jgi:hypothetical protein
MKTLILIAALATVQSHALTDFTCVTDCTAKGYLYGLCMSQCTTNEGQSTFSSGSGGSGQTDYTCVSDCEAKGYRHAYCRSRCSY